MIVVGIDTAQAKAATTNMRSGKTRSPMELKEPDGRQLPSFFGSELMPYVSARYKVSDDAAHTGIGGTSGRGFRCLSMWRLSVLICLGLATGRKSGSLAWQWELLRDTTLLLRAPDRVAIGVGTTEYNFPQSKAYFAPLRRPRGTPRPRPLKTTKTSVSNLEKAFFKRPEVQLVVEPGANHSAVYWSRRIPAAIAFLYGEPRRAHRVDSEIRNHLISAVANRPTRSLTDSGCVVGYL